MAPKPVGQMVLLLALSLENKQLKQNKKTEFEIM
jgi:hypothetical protein